MFWKVDVRCIQLWANWAFVISMLFLNAFHRCMHTVIHIHTIAIIAHSLLTLSLTLQVLWNFQVTVHQISTSETFLRQLLTGVQMLLNFIDIICITKYVTLSINRKFNHPCLLTQLLLRASKLLIFFSQAIQTLSIDCVEINATVMRTMYH